MDLVKELSWDLEHESGDGGYGIGHCPRSYLKQRKGGYVRSLLSRP